MTKPAQHKGPVGLGGSPPGVIVIKRPIDHADHPMQAEHKPKHAEGPFFTSLLEAVGCPDPDRGSNPSKRLKLSGRIKDACARNGSGLVVMLFDEAQRYGENEYEWLRVDAGVDPRLFAGEVSDLDIDAGWLRGFEGPRRSGPACGP